MIVFRENNYWEFRQYIDEEKVKASHQTMDFDDIDLVALTDSAFVNSQVALLRRGNKYGLFSGYYTPEMVDIWRNPFQDPFPFDEIKYYANMFDDVIPAIFACRIGDRWGAIDVVYEENETNEINRVDYPLTRSRKIVDFNQKSFAALEAKLGLVSWAEFGDQRYAVERKMMYAENYLELEVPVDYDADWFKNLRAAVNQECGAEHVSWKKNNYHITVAFFKDDTHVGELKQTFDQIMNGSAAPELTFDEVDTFVTHDEKEYIVHLTSTHPSPEFIALVGKLHEAALKTGAELELDFRPHVTLARIAEEHAVIEDLMEVVGSIEVPPFTLALNEAEYRYRPTPRLVHWRLPRKTDYRGINKHVMLHTQRQCEKSPLLRDAVWNSRGKQFMVAQEETVDRPAVEASHTRYVTSVRRTFEAAKAYKGKKTAVLNFANNHSVGGAPFSAGAQEESLCRCSTLYPCLQAMQERFYNKHIEEYGKKVIDNMGSDDLIYTPDVVVFKTDERTDPVYPRMMKYSDWYKVDVITCAAPELRYRARKPRGYEEMITRRIKKILDVAAKEKVEVLILGAWGCGAFGNDIAVVSKAFYSLLENYDFETVEFALGSTKFFDHFPKGTMVR